MSSNSPTPGDPEPSVLGAVPSAVAFRGVAPAHGGRSSLDEIWPNGTGANFGERIAGIVVRLNQQYPEQWPDEVANYARALETGVRSSGKGSRKRADIWLRQLPKPTTWVVGRGIEGHLSLMPGEGREVTTFCRRNYSYRAKLWATNSLHK